MTKKKNRNPEIRDKAVNYVNTILSFITLIIGGFMLVFASLAADEIEIEMAIDVIVCLALTVPFILAFIHELNAILIRRRKSVLYESLPYMIVYALLSVFSLLLPVALTEQTPVILVVLFSIYVFARLGKVVYLLVRKGGKGRIIIGVVLALFGIASIIYCSLNYQKTCDAGSFIGFYFIIEGLSLVFYTLLSRINLRTVGRIFVKTHAAEILVGLLILIAAISIVLPFLPGETNINTFGEALWYCFAVVTTIGFGDYFATSFFGRVLSVILGIYGVVIVALLTSIIVNMYNEKTANEEKAIVEKNEKEIEEIKK